MAANDILRIGWRKAGNAGLLTTLGGVALGELLHTIPTVTLQGVTFTRSYIIRKIMWYNNSGANAVLTIGTRNGTPGFVPLLPPIWMINTFDGELTEAELPAVEFISTPVVGVLAAAQRDGNCYCVTAAAGVMVAIECEEFGA